MGVADIMTVKGSGMIALTKNLTSCLFSKILESIEKWPRYCRYLQRGCSGTAEGRVEGVGGVVRRVYKGALSGVLLALLLVRRL